MERIIVEPTQKELAKVPKHIDPKRVVVVLLKDHDDGLWNMVLKDVKKQIKNKTNDRIRTFSVNGILILPISIENNRMVAVKEKER